MRHREELARREGDPALARPGCPAPDDRRRAPTERMTPASSTNAPPPAPGTLCQAMDPLHTPAPTDALRAAAAAVTSAVAGSVTSTAAGSVAGAAAGAVARSATRAEVVEQVMRATADDLAVVEFLSPDPATPEAEAALGRALGRVDLPLTPGCPVVAFVTGTSVAARWRAEHPVRAGSLWAQLEWLRRRARTEGGISTCEDPLEELDQLRGVCDESA